MAPPTKEVKREKIVRVLFTELELADVKAEAETSGMPVAVYIRALVLADIVSKKSKRSTAKES